ncbi:hypothetical protein DOE51_06140 [Bdellovibrio sp. NC01]|nr:hypothetical protein DOE51_06140 [Bdellovibrio sp. NC01]
MKVLLVALVLMFVVKMIALKLSTPAEKQGDHMETKTCALSVSETVWAIGTQVIAAAAVP